MIWRDKLHSKFSTLDFSSSTSSFTSFIIYSLHSALIKFTGFSEKKTLYRKGDVFYRNCNQVLKYHYFDFCVQLDIPILRYGVCVMSFCTFKCFVFFQPVSSTTCFDAFILDKFSFGVWKPMTNRHVTRDFWGRGRFLQIRTQTFGSL